MPHMKIQTQDRWCPRATVATVVVEQERYLLVEERPTGAESVYNQPAGHLEPGESLLDGARRETFEETGWHVELTHYLGVALWTSPSGLTFLRHSFVAKTRHFDPTAALDQAIIATHWLSYQDILALRAHLRSPLVLTTIEHYRKGLTGPLSMVTDGNSAP